MLLLFGLPIALLVAIAVVSLARRHSPSDRIMLILFSAPVVAFAVVVRNKSILYAILASPVVGPPIAAYIDMLLGVAWRTSRAVFLQFALAAGLVIASVCLILTLTADPTQEYQASLSLVRNASAPGRFGYRLPNVLVCLAEPALLFVGATRVLPAH